MGVLVLTVTRRLATRREKLKGKIGLEISRVTLD